MHKARTIGILILICLSLLMTACANKYAMLISTGRTTSDDSLYHSEYWYDLFIEYQMLRENGFKDENIYVLYGDGNDFGTDYPDYNATATFGHSIADMAVNKGNIQSVFNHLSTRVTSRDYFYSWWMGHGSGMGPGMCDLRMHISTTGEIVTDAELTTYLNQIQAFRKRNLAVMTCHSGGLVDNLDVAGTRTLVLTSSTCAQSSYSTTTTCNGRGHAEFNYTFPNALRQKDPCGAVVTSDTDNNGRVSIFEAHQYNLANMTRSTPQLGDPDGVAPTTELIRNQP
jgi:hypothetical protein